MSELYFCASCKTYTLELICSKCKQKTINNRPPRFSPQDPYGKYRRELKKITKKEG